MGANVSIHFLYLLNESHEVCFDVLVSLMIFMVEFSEHICKLKW